MFRSLALAAAVALALGSTAKADIVFTGPGGPIPNFVGFDPGPGNTLNVGGVQAVQNFINGQSGSNVMFQSYSQAQIVGAITTNGLVSLPSGADYTAVLGATERVTSVTGSAVGNASATFGFVTPAQYAAAGSSTSLGANPYVNYFEIWQGGTASNNLSGAGFNGQGGATLVLAGILTDLTTTSNFTSNSNTIGALDQFPTPAPGDNNYPGNNSILLNGGFTVSGTITAANPAFFGGANLIGSAFNITSNVAAPFAQVNPSAGFLIGTTNTGGVGAPTTSGVGNGANGAGAGIGTINGSNGQSVRVQNDSSVTFQVAPGTNSTPEPATLVVFGLRGGMGGLVYRRRNAKAAA